MKKVALVHEMLMKLWGAEKVLENWTHIFPEADIFTLIYDEKQVSKFFPKEKIHPQVFSLRTQKIYNFTWKQRLCLPFMAKSIESLDLSVYDIVLVSSSWFAHGVITKPETKTLVYYHAPARYMWDWTNEYKRDIGAQKWIKSYILNSLFLKLRQWDYIASKRHDITLSNSITTQKRIKKYFHLDSQVLYPPIETQRFATHTSQSFELPIQKPYYITLSALTEFKRIDIAIHAFKKTPEISLLVIWDWEYRKKLEEQTENSKNIFFVGKKFGDELVYIVQNSLGLIFPGEEDFWIVPIEVMAAGKSVFALKRWGLTETVIADQTWDFFEDPEGKDFLEKFGTFHQKNIAGVFVAEACTNQAARFDKALFEARIKNLIEV